MLLQKWGVIFITHTYKYLHGIFIIDENLGNKKQREIDLAVSSRVSKQQNSAIRKQREIDFSVYWRISKQQNSRNRKQRVIILDESF